MKRVVVTGIGVVSCLGNNQEEVYQSLLNSKSGITFSEATHETTLGIRSYLPGDKVVFDPLVLRFIVDEDMVNYREIYSWIIQLAPGFDTDDHKELIGSTKTTTGFDNRSGDYTKMYSDATLIVNTSSNNANVEFVFEDCFPTSLGSVEFKTDATDTEYVVADLTLRYTLFKVNVST